MEGVHRDDPLDPNAKETIEANHLRTEKRCLTSCEKMQKVQSKQTRSARLFEVRLAGASLRLFRSIPCCLKKDTKECCRRSRGVSLTEAADRLTGKGQHDHQAASRFPYPHSEATIKNAAMDYTRCSPDHFSALRCGARLRRSSNDRSLHEDGVWKP
ncbi:hypothetical protein VTN31DRAFT_5086 [Thermomyces dupontii]|uniref:uncharacterized protein n=1 Tax=Talaromyces thermophilus TaxID=28565 RepID=UPI0037439C16